MNDEEFDQTNIAVLDTLMNEGHNLGIPSYINAMIAQIISDNRRIKQLETELGIVIKDHYVVKEK